jgi:hypothetical protein
MKKPDYEWWIQHSHTDSAFLLLVDSPDLFEQAILSRLKEVKRKPDQGVINQATWRAIHEQDRFGSMSSIIQSIQPEPEVAPSRPFVGNLRTDQRALRDDQGSFPAVGVSSFWVPWSVQNDLRILDRLAEWAVGCGMTYARWFGSHNWPGGVSTSTQDYMRLLEWSIEELQSRGLRSQITMFTRRYIVDDPVELMNRLAVVVNRHRDAVCLVECVNEWNHTDNDWSDNEVRSAAAAFQERCDAPFALSAPSAETWEDMKERLTHLNTGSSASATTIHFPRKQTTSEGEWRWVRQPWHGRWPIEGCPDFVVDNEHQRWDKSSSGREVAVAAAAPLNAFIAGCGMSTHHDVFGVHINEGEYSSDLASQRLQKVLSKVIPLLPPDVANWQSTRVGEGGGPHPFPSLLNQQWSTEDTDTGVSRSFAAVRGDDFVMCLNGVRGSVTLHESHPKKFRVISLDDGVTIHEGHGPTRLSEVDGQAFYVGTM